MSAEELEDRLAAVEREIAQIKRQITPTNSLGKVPSKARKLTRKAVGLGMSRIYGTLLAVSISQSWGCHYSPARGDILTTRW